jgi:hypothetical protein
LSKNKLESERKRNDWQPLKQNRIHSKKKGPKENKDWLHNKKSKEDYRSSRNKIKRLHNLSLKLSKSKSKNSSMSHNNSIEHLNRKKMTRKKELLKPWNPSNLKNEDEKKKKK